MSNQLAPVIDEVFAEYTAPTSPSQALRTPLSLVKSIEPFAIGINTDDSDWFDVILEDAQPQSTQPEGNIKPFSAAPATRIPASASITGDLSLSCETAQIDGTITGNIINSQGEVRLGKQAIVHGNIDAKTVKVEGIVCGNVTADTVTLLPNSSIQGNIVYKQAIEIRENAELCGHVSRQSA